MTLQVKLGLCQKDVIDEWDRPDAMARAQNAEAITDCAWIWDRGLV
ncbi:MULTISPECIES: hypothetical protein [Methylobacteriaceae]